MADVKTTFSSSKITKVLFGLVSAVIAIHLIGQVWLFNANETGMVYMWTDILNRFDMGDEISVPTWLSQALFLLSSTLLAIITLGARQLHDDSWKQWAALSGLFLYASVDEGSSLHEMLAYLDIPLWLGLHQGYFSFAWIIPGILLMVIVIIAFSKFWIMLPQRTKYIFLIALALFASGAILTEMVSANYYSRFGTENFGYSGLLAAIEEGLEKFGMVVFIYGLLDYLKLKEYRLTINFSR